MATTSNKIFIGIDDQVIEVKGAEKDALLADLEAREQEKETRKAQELAQKALKVSAYTKLGLTEEEINAIL